MGESSHSSSIYTTMKLIVVLLAGLCLAAAQRSSGQRESGNMRFARQLQNSFTSGAALSGQYSMQTDDGSFKHSGTMYVDPTAMARFRAFGLQMMAIMNSAQGRSSGGFGGNQGGFGGSQGGLPPFPIQFDPYDD